MSALRLITFAFLFIVVFIGPASAQSLSGCSGIEGTTGPKVVLDKLEYRNEAGEIQILTSDYELELILELRSRLQNLFPDTQPLPVLCAKRAPKPDGTDFIPSLVKTLNNRNVLLEIWGTIKAGKKNGKQALGANILMMLIPVRYYEGSDSQLDFHILSYPKKEEDDLEAASIEIAFGTEFNVYAAIAHGIKALRNNSYDKAKKYFSDARIQWENALADGSLANTPTNQDLILQYIKNLEQKTITEAAADPNYSGDLVALADMLEDGGP